ncbi:MAG: rod shape-determining protein MreC, partial [Acidimicrobiia bacterium]
MRRLQGPWGTDAMRERPGDRVVPTLITLVVVSFLLMTFDIRAAGQGVVGSLRAGTQSMVGPAQALATTVVDPVADFVEGLASIAGLREENQRLRRELDEARGQLALVEDDRARVVVLEQLVGLDGTGEDLVRTAANVIGHNDTFDLSFTIDKGSADGVLAGHPVIDPNGYLVGKVLSVAEHFATVVP